MSLARLARLRLRPLIVACCNGKASGTYLTEIFSRIPHLGAIYPVDDSHIERSLNDLSKYCQENQEDWRAMESYQNLRKLTSKDCGTFGQGSLKSQERNALELVKHFVTSDPSDTVRGMSPVAVVTDPNSVKLVQGAIRSMTLLDGHHLPTYACGVFEVQKGALDEKDLAAVRILTGQAHYDLNALYPVTTSSTAATLVLPTTDAAKEKFSGYVLGEIERSIDPRTELNRPSAISNINGPDLHGC